MDSDSSPADEALLMTRARSDPDAFIRLYRRHYDPVFRYCVHRLFDRQAAEDATSEVFLKVVGHFGRFKGNAGQFRSWLYRIATNLINDHFRKTAHRARLLERAGQERTLRIVAGESTEGSSSDRLTALREAILNLKPRYQTIITLRFFEEMKLTEIAELLGSSNGTIRSQLARALAQLRKRLRIADGGETND